MWYWFGKGTPKDDENAYLWLSIAVKNGINKLKFRLFRDFVGMFMTRAQRAEARKKAAEWKAANSGNPMTDSELP